MDILHTVGTSSTSEARSESFMYVRKTFQPVRVEDGEAVSSQDSNLFAWLVQELQCPKDLRTVKASSMHSERVPQHP